MDLLTAFDPWDVAPFAAVGFAAQLVDGALGMAFGVISSTLLVGLGVPPAAASAGVHVVETFTTCASGISHVWQRNVDWRLFARLALPSVAGGALGAYVLASVSAAAARPAILAYLAIMGAFLLWRGLRHTPPPPRPPRVVAPLGLVGGFLDAAGGGGFGPVVTSNLLAQGGPPRNIVGTVNLAEFFLTVTVSATFIATLGLSAFTEATTGLLIGGLLASPFGAIVARRIAARSLLTMVGVVLIATSLWGIWSHVTR